jgi:hypothetical protein
MHFLGKVQNQVDVFSWHIYVKLNQSLVGRTNTDSALRQAQEEPITT